MKKIKITIENNFFDNSNHLCIGNIEEADEAIKEAIEENEVDIIESINIKNKYIENKKCYFTVSAGEYCIDDFDFIVEWEEQELFGEITNMQDFINNNLNFLIPVEYERYKKLKYLKIYEEKNYKDFIETNYSDLNIFDSDLDIDDNFEDFKKSLFFFADSPSFIETVKNSDTEEFKKLKEILETCKYESEEIQIKRITQYINNCIKEEIKILKKIMAR